MHRRRLPHVYPEDHWLFLTWHLYGSMPKARYPPPGHASAGKAFVWMDRYMDTTRVGPLHLLRPEIAGLVVAALVGGAEQGLYDLGAYVVMANHVHVLLRPHGDARRVLQWLKGTTARDANRILNRLGEPFWQKESYDHCVRDAHEFVRVVSYIENNPVVAGLVVEASQYRWSSAWGGERAARAETAG